MTVADLVLVLVAVGLWLALVALALRGWRKRGRKQAEQLGEFGVPIVVSSALDSVVGMGAALAAW